MSRADDLAAALERLRARIAAACTAAGRPADDVTLVAVTKTWPASDVAILADLGVTDVGENRDQEARPKVAEVAELRPGAELRWHFVGRLQRNKARSVAHYADVVHSVDRAPLAVALDTAAGDLGRDLDLLVQVSLDGDTARGGALPADVPALADLIAGLGSVRLAGLMAVAPLGAEPGPAFARLAELAAAVRRDHPGATAISAGMSGDLEAAVKNGATHVRVGTALLGGRSPVSR